MHVARCASLVCWVPCGCTGTMVAWQRGVEAQQQQRDKGQRAALKWRSLCLSGAFDSWRAYSQQRAARQAKCAAAAARWRAVHVASAWATR